jgi:hypothetical protein
MAVGLSACVQQRLTLRAIPYGGRAHPFHVDERIVQPQRTYKIGGTEGHASPLNVETITNTQ